MPTNASLIYAWKNTSLIAQPSAVLHYTALPQVLVPMILAESGQLDTSTNEQQARKSCAGGCAWRGGGALHIGSVFRSYTVEKSLSVECTPAGSAVQ